ncbi:MAG: hypothetical protein K1X88_17245, partial [Nannocystaceae bacterium]|nr:hypothetical protein [Nannocystaceae bacterium]
PRLRAAPRRATVNWSMPSSRARRLAPVLGLLALAPAGAHAANGTMPRTPALYPPHPCLTLVDRSTATTTHFDVHIPFEDTQLTEDELPDSRTLRFVALCREPSRLEPLPNWIEADDAMRALDAGIIDALPDAADVLRDSPAWRPGHDGASDSCVQLATPQPLAISCAATAAGVDWDVTAVPAGNYVLRGYTFAPPSNLWTARTGVVQVHDGAPLPVAALVSPVYDAKAFALDGYRVLGCMDGPPGTTVTLQWASTTADDLDADASWTSFAELDASAHWIDLELALGEDMVYLGLLLRAVARGPDGASWIAHSPGFVTVYPGDGASDPPQVEPGPDHCDAGGDESGGIGVPEGSTSGATAGDSSGGSSEGGPAEVERDAGCGCGAQPRVPAALWWCACLLAWRRRGPSRRAAASPSSRPAR